MHELAFAEDVLACILRETEPYAPCRVKRVRLRAGRYLGLEPSSLVFCLEAIAEGTPAAGALLDMQTDDDGNDLVIEEIELDDEDDQT